MSRSGTHGRWLAVTVTVLAVLACPGCSEKRAFAPLGAPDDSRAVVRRGELHTRFLLTGELKAVRAIGIVVPRTPAWQVVIRWMETDGAVVARGQKILEFDNSQFAGDLEQKRLTESRLINELARRQAEIAVELADRRFRVESARLGLAKAELEAAVPRELRPLREFQEKQLELERARVERDKADADLAAFRDSAAAEIEVLRIGLSKARNEIETAERAIEALTLRAPADGILIVEQNFREDRKYQVGDSVWVGLTVMRIPDLSAMRVEADLSDVDDGRITPGMRASCTLDTYPDLEFPGTVVEITPIAQEVGRRSLRRAFRVALSLDGADPERMRPGMSVKAVIEPPVRRDVLLVPRTALDLSSEAPRARLPGGDVVEVTLGPCSAAECVVEQGLAEGRLLEAGDALRASR